MDGKAAQVMMQMNVGVFKEPRAFMKILQFVFSIFAFATTCGFGSSLAYKIVTRAPPCEHESDKMFEYKYSYPFRLNHIEVHTCYDRRLTGDFSSQSEYFVATGVLTFLYCLAAMILYVFFDQLYRSNPTVPIVDFGITVVFAVFWLTASAAWSQGVADVKYFTDPHNIFKQVCSKAVGDTHGTNCIDNVSAGSFASLNVSLIFGYLNFVLWAANLWFIYKETTWFQRRPQSTPEDGGQHM